MLNIVSGSRTGKRHAENQDAFGVRRFEQTGSTLLVVADGIGSHAFGGSVARWLVSQLIDSEETFDAMRDAASFEDYLMRVHQRFKSEFDDFEEMLASGASISAAIVSGNMADCFWAGDSPIYHSWKLPRPGTRKIAEADVGSTGGLTNCFRGTSDLRLSRTQLELADGDILTLASDGLAADEWELTDVFNRLGVTQGMIDELLETSMAQPSSDDVTMIAYQHRTAGDF